MSAPLYEHDCLECKFLGNDKLQGQSVDVYVCPQMGMPTIIIRLGDFGHDYNSWNMMFMDSPERFRGISSYDLAYGYVDQAKEALASNKE